MGKPPISDDAMRSMFAAMVRLRTARRESAVWTGHSRDAKAYALAEPESLLAGILSQMHHRDTLVTSGTHPLLPVALEQFFAVPVASLHTVASVTEDEETSAIAAGMALKSMDGAREPVPVTVVLLRSFPALKAALALLHTRDLPLLVVAQGEIDPRDVTERRAKGMRVPLLPVDSNDAVAVCRVMQEALLRARNGWGGTVIHAIRLQGSQDAVAEMRKRMEARNLLAAETSSTVRETVKQRTEMR